MDTAEYFRSLSLECEALKNRVRMLISDQHWLTDGEWKESVLRGLIRRSAPNSVSVGQGFILTSEQVSRQIDILIYDNSLPVIYRDGDLVFVPPVSCKAIIEVKSSLNATTLQSAATILADNAKIVRDSEPDLDLFVGIFSYEYTGQDTAAIPRALNAAAAGDPSKVVNHASLGTSLFSKYWETNPSNQQNAYNTWHQYNLNQMAQGYFIHNILSYLCGHKLVRNENVWFPIEGKETNLQHNIQLTRA